jgi:hypothetical protein
MQFKVISIRYKKWFDLIRFLQSNQIAPEETKVISFVFIKC